MNVSIEYVAFITLYEEAIKLVDTSKNHITAVKISYGLDKKNKICLLYTPLAFISPIPKYGSKSEFIGYEYTIVDKGDFYIHEGRGFRIATPEEQNFLKEYTNIDPKQARIHIKHKPKEELTPFKEGDVRSVIFSFQEIFALVQNNMDKLSKTARKFINISNYIRQVSGVSGKENKHSLLMLSSNSIRENASFSDFLESLELLDINSMLEFIDFLEKYADLPHLCPPSCGSAIIRLENP
jgi:hypothetical protein